MQRFEYVIDISRQLITMSLGIIIGVSAFLDSIYKNEGNILVFSLIVFYMFLLILSMISGVFHIGSVANAVEQQERDPSVFVSTFDNKYSSYLCRIQQLSFIISVFVFIISFVIDRLCG